MAGKDVEDLMKAEGHKDAGRRSLEVLDLTFKELTKQPDAEKLEKPEAVNGENLEARQQTLQDLAKQPDAEPDEEYTAEKMGRKVEPIEETDILPLSGEVHNKQEDNRCDRLFTSRATTTKVRLAS